VAADSDETRPPTVTRAFIIERRDDGESRPLRAADIADIGGNATIKMTCAIKISSVPRRKPPLRHDSRPFPEVLGAPDSGHGRFSGIARVGVHTSVDQRSIGVSQLDATPLDFQI